MANTNLSSTTREMWERTLKPQVIMRNPLLARLEMDGGIIVQGGTAFKHTVQKAEMVSGVQNYTVDEDLTDQDPDLFATAQWTLKRKQIGIRYDADEDAENMPPEQIVPLVSQKLVIGQRSMRTSLKQDAYRAPSGTVSSDSSSAPASLLDALATTRVGASLAYGGVTSSTTSNVWWNPASTTGAYNDSGTSIKPYLANFDLIWDTCNTWVDGQRSEWLALVSPTIYRSLKAEINAKSVLVNVNTRLAKLGFSAFEYDQLEFVSDPYLDRNEMDAASSPGAINTTRQKYAFCLHIPSWRFLIHSKRNFRLEDAFWQGKISRGRDYWLQRALFRGNLITVQPNASCAKTNMA